MAGTLVLVVLAFVPTLTPISAQTTTNKASSWTFSEPGVSHISFSPPLSDSKVLMLELSFRTLQPNGLLVYQDIPEYDEVEEKEISPLLDSFHLVVEMSQGHLRVGHMFDHYKDILNTGSGKQSICMWCVCVCACARARACVCVYVCVHTWYVCVYEYVVCLCA